MNHTHFYTSAITLVIGLVLGYLFWGVGLTARDVRPMSPESSMHTTMNGMMSGLSEKTGDEFDRAFLAEMIVHHEGAVAMANQVLATSKRPELLKLAHDIITAQTSEIKMMRDWQTLWFE